MSGGVAAFMSYARFDDQHEAGRLTLFRESLSAEVRMQIGEEFRIFQDRNDIAWGQDWQQRIDQALDEVTLLIAIVTPGFLRSAACREEVERFRARESALGRDDLILPIYYVSTPELDDRRRRDGDAVAQLLASRQFADWRELRFEPLTSPPARKALAKLAARMRDTFWRPLPPPPARISSQPKERHERSFVQVVPQIKDESSIPAPLVLIGNPRLGSEPGALPRVMEPLPDTVLDGAKLPGIVVRAASLRGDRHRYDGSGRQDSIGLWTLDPPTELAQESSLLLACVADGVGSKRMSHVGSAIACSLLRQRVTEHIAKLATSSTSVPYRCRQIMAEVSQDLRSYAADLELSSDDVATTLTAALVIVKPGAPKLTARAVIFGVGDDRGFLLRKTWQSIFPPAFGEKRTRQSEVEAIPIHPDRCAVTETSELNDGDMLMLCTDGLSMPMEFNSSVREQFSTWWGHSFVPSLPEFYWQMSFRAQTYDDDRSAICIWLKTTGR